VKIMLQPLLTLALLDWELNVTLIEVYFCQLSAQFYASEREPCRLTKGSAAVASPNFSFASAALSAIAA